MKEKRPRSDRLKDKSDSSHRQSFARIYRCKSIKKKITRFWQPTIMPKANASKKFINFSSFFYSLKRRYEEQNFRMTTKPLVVFLWNGNRRCWQWLVDRRNAHLQLSQAGCKVGPRYLMRQRPSPQIQRSVKPRVWRIVHGARCRSGGWRCAFAGEELFDTDTLHLFRSPESADLWLDVRVLLVGWHLDGRTFLHLVAAVFWRSREVTDVTSWRVRDRKLLQKSKI